MFRQCGMRSPASDILFAKVDERLRMGAPPPILCTKTRHRWRDLAPRSPVRLKRLQELHDVTPLAVVEVKVHEPVVVVLDRP
jgi:hypothetical protein